MERELRADLRCRSLAHDFVLVHCDECGLDRVVAFSRKGRGFCFSRGAPRMADTAAHLVDRVLQEVTIRQWVLSRPTIRLATSLRSCVGWGSSVVD